MFKTYNLDIFQLTDKKQQTKNNNFLMNIWRDNWRFINCCRKRTPLLWLMMGWVILKQNADIRWTKRESIYQNISQTQNVLKSSKISLENEMRGIFLSVIFWCLYMYAKFITHDMYQKKMVTSSLYVHNVSKIDHIYLSELYTGGLLKCFFRIIKGDATIQLSHVFLDVLNFSYYENLTRSSLFRIQ